MNQPFDPLEFLRLAQQLAGQGAGERELRTAVGRTYYALFLIARDRTGVTARQGAHKAVRRAVKVRRGHKSTASQLGSLQRLREVADYEELPADPSQRDWAANWQTVDTIATHILPRLQSL